MSTFFKKTPILKNAYVIVKRDRCTPAVMQPSSVINIYMRIALPQYFPHWVLYMN